MIAHHYNHETFQAPPDLSKAGSAFNPLDGHEIVKKVLMPLVGKCCVENKLGAILAYRHFDLEENEQLVEYKDTSVLWSANTANLFPSS
ncbi:hypothetical protein KCU77_g514, partial [Aureobasidium melanogenum]